jgi:hypothetical protein
MRSNNFTALMTTAAMMLSFGCAVDRSENIDPRLEAIQTHDVADESYRPVRGAVEGRLVGDVGPVTGINGDANLLSAYDDGYYLSVETVLELQGRAVMTLLSVSNGALVFVPGLEATFTLDDTSEDEVQVTMLGCVGQEVGVYDEYDAPADEVTVGVDAGESEDEMAVGVRARWYDRDPATGERLATFNSAQTRFTLLR